MREQPVRKKLPNDAIGTTTGVTGAIAVDAKGTILTDRSRIVVDVASLESDNGRRDGYVRGRLLQMAAHPTVTLVRDVAVGAAE